MYTGFIADYINSQLQVIACNHIDGEMAVCCPKNPYDSDSREKRGGHGKHGQGKHNYGHGHGHGEKKWIWDTEEVTDSEEIQSPGGASPTQYPSSQYTSYPIQGFYPFSKENLKNSKFVAEHEDPNSLKSCPPQFAEEFDLPKNHSFFKEPEEAVTPSLRVAVVTTPSPTVPAPLLMPDLQAKMSMINDESCGRSIGSRIIGGEDAGVGRFAWIGRLAYRNKSKLINFKCIN